MHRRSCRTCPWLKTMGSSSKSLKSWEGSRNGANTASHLRQQLFAVSSFHLTAWQNWHMSYIGGRWWRWICSWKTVSSPIVILTNHSARHILGALGCVALISQAWMLSSCVISALRSARRRMFCSRIIRASQWLILECSEFQLVGVAPRSS
jgi:hypothetical protein